ncbi:MAG TPA: hypothetical protein VIZ22_09295 [Candidatus Limnocylindrales bacterium]
MHRLLVLVAAAALMLGLAAPAALAAEPTSNNRSVVASIAHDVTIPAGDHVDLLFIVRGHADIAGSVDSIVVIDGTATLTGATANSLVVMNGTADLTAGTRISGDVRTYDATVTRSADTVVGGSVGTFERNAAALALLLIPLFLLLFIGLGVTALAVALFVAAFAARQVRHAESLISHEPGTVLVAGIAGSVVLPILAVLAMITIVGAPLGLGVLFLVLPVMAFLGWIVAAIWVGDWLLGRSRGTAESAHPYLAAVVGVIVLAFAGIVPFVSAIATLFGFGALLVIAWRILRPSRPVPTAPVATTGPAQPAPSAG